MRCPTCECRFGEDWPNLADTVEDWCVTDGRCACHAEPPPLYRYRVTVYAAGVASFRGIRVTIVAASADEARSVARREAVGAYLGPVKNCGRVSLSG